MKTGHTINRILRATALFVLLLLPCIAHSQELNCDVTINSEQVQGSNKSVFETLQEAVRDYMNSNHFTNDQYATNERIDCRLYLTISEYTDDTMKGDLQVQSSRPVYNSSYTTTLINFKDSKIEFTYQEGEPLTFTVNTMESQLTAILNFYAYLIIAVDRDSFASHGGDDAFEQLKMVVQMAQSSGENGWKAFEDKKNRSAILDAYTSPSTSVLRDLTYTYHRNGLDEMFMSPDKGRAKITEAVESLQKVYNADAMSVGLSMFKDAKLDELVNVYTKASQTEREKVVDILSPMFPTEMKRINQIKAGTNK
jgi:hypothetical protein